MALVTEPIALDRSLNTTEQTSRNIADVLAQALQMLNTTISGLNFINCVVVQTLPTTDISTTTIYLVPKNPSQTDNLYDEYINLTGTSAGWEKIGDTEIDLSGYYTSAEVDDLLADKADVSDIPTVNDGTLTIQQNGETKGTFTANQSGNSTVNIEAPTTDIQTAVDEFETYNGGLLSECKVALSPIQDLHGYDHPWAGGADINMLDIASYFSGNPITTKGVTFTLVTDADGNATGIKGSGTATDYAYIDVQIILEAGRYKTAVSGNDASKMNFNLRKGANKAYFVEGNTEFTLSEQTLIFARYYVGQNNTADNTITCMLYEYSGTDKAFRPYSNICPITGHTQVEVDVSDGQTTQEQITVNLGGTYYSGTLDVVSGVFTPDTASVDLGTLTWTYNNTNFVATDITGGVAKSGKTCICSCYATVNNVQYSTDIIADHSICMSTLTANRLYVHDSGYSDAATFKTAVTGQKVVYELATPQSIQLSPTMVKALVDENNLSAPLEGQEITEVKYKKMFTFDDVIAYIQSLS